jgi:hypothetical protein
MVDGAQAQTGAAAGNVDALSAAAAESLSGLLAQQGSPEPILHVAPPGAERPPGSSRHQEEFCGL